MIELLLLIGVDVSDVIIIETPTLFSEVLIPDDCFLTYEQEPGYTYEYVSIVERIRTQIHKSQRLLEKCTFQEHNLDRLRETTEKNA